MANSLLEVRLFYNKLKCVARNGKITLPLWLVLSWLYLVFSELDGYSGLLVFGFFGME